MFVDAQLLFSSAQAFTVDAMSTNVIDSTIARQLADGEGLSIYIHPTVAADHTTGNETYNFILQTDDNAAMASATDLVNWAVLYSALAANVLIELPIPEGTVFEEFLGVYFDGGGTTPTLTADIWLGKTGSRPNVKTYPATNRKVG